MDATTAKETLVGDASQVRILEHLLSATGRNRSDGADDTTATGVK